MVAEEYCISGVPSYTSNGAFVQPQERQLVRVCGGYPYIEDSCVGQEEKLAFDVLQRSDEHGNPPLGLIALAPYRFGKLQMCQTHAWQSLIITTPLDQIQSEKLEHLLPVFARSTLGT